VSRTSSATIAETIVKNVPDDVTAKEIRANINQLDKEGYIRIKDKSHHNVTVIFISLSQLDDIDSSLSEAVNSIHTYLNIEPAQAFDLYKAAELIVQKKLETRIKAIVTEIQTADQKGKAP
jgi:hypothetical protein